MPGCQLAYPTMLLLMVFMGLCSRSSAVSSCDASPNCRARNRQDCLPPKSTCGPCLVSFTAPVESAYANTPCETQGAANGSMGKLPVVDIQKLQLGGAARAEEMKKLEQALSGPGFMHLSNAGISTEQLFKDMRRFFERPLEEKMRSAWSDPVDNSGYVPSGGEGLDEDSVEGDPKESYEMNKDHLRTSFWNNTAAVDYWVAINGLKEVVLGGYEEVLGLETGYFIRAHNEEFNNLRLLHYFPINSATNRKSDYRVGPHSDYGSLTLLVQDAIGGLQVLDRVSGHWVEVAPIPGTVLCNTADLMMRWTNDRLPSTLHRVVGPGEHGVSEVNIAASRRDRYSVVFFVNPNKEHTVQNLMADEVARYPSISSIDYLVQRLSATFKDSVDVNGDSKQDQCLGQCAA